MGPEYACVVFPDGTLHKAYLGNGHLKARAPHDVRRFNALAVPDSKPAVSE